MPVALYAVSHAKTFSVLAICSLEKQTLPDQAAWDNLRDRLVGDKLAISMTTNTLRPIMIDASELAVDEVAATDLNPIYDNPYAFMLAEQAGTALIAGDGKPKKLTTPVKVVTVTLKPNGALTITRTIKTKRLTVCVVFEGEAAVTQAFEINDTFVDFHPTTPTVANNRYAVVVIAQDCPTIAMMVTAKP
jgi:hypothetical protein